MGGGGGGGFDFLFHGPAGPKKNEFQKKLKIYLYKR